MTHYLFNKKIIMKTITFKSIKTFPVPMPIAVNLSGKVLEKDQIEDDRFIVADFMCKKFLVHKDTMFGFYLRPMAGGILPHPRDMVMTKGVEYYIDSLEDLQVQQAIAV